MKGDLLLATKIMEPAARHQRPAAARDLLNERQLEKAHQDLAMIEPTFSVAGQQWACARRPTASSSPCAPGEVKDRYASEQDTRPS